MKLQTKLTVFAILLIGIAVFICCALILSFVQSAERSDITKTGLEDYQAFYQTFRDILIGDLPENEIVRHSMLVSAFRAKDGFVEFTLKENGEILSSNVGFDVESLFESSKTVSIDSPAETQHKILRLPGGDYFLAHTTLSVGEKQYDLSLARNITQSTNEIRNLAVKCAIVGIVITALSAGAMRIIVLRAMRPVDRLREGAGELARGHYENRIEMRGHDELAELAGDFNTMADAIEANITHLNEKTIRQQTFINDLSHEMKTPVTSILLSAETLRDRNVPKEMLDHLLTRIYDQGKCLELLSQKLMTLVLLQQKLDLREERVSALIDAVRETSEDALREQGITLVTSCQADTLWMDFDLMRSALVNLVMNAKSASSFGQSVELRAYARVIEVIDHGKGIEAEDIQLVTEPFYRVDRARSKKHGGAGLGLTLVKHIAEAHRARLVIQSVVSQGTIVRLEFLPKDEE